MANSKRLSPHQLMALDDARRGGLVRKVFGWAKPNEGFAGHGWQTVQSLVDRGLMVPVPGGKRVLLSRAGRAAAP